MPRITKRTVDDARPDPSHRIYLRDDELKGFGLTVTPTGAKSYFVEYRLPGGRAAAKGKSLSANMVLHGRQIRQDERPPRYWGPLAVE